MKTALGIQQLRVVLLVHPRLLGRIRGLLKFSNQGREPWRQDNQVSSAERFVGVGDARRDEDGSPGTHVNHAIDEVKSQGAFEHAVMPVLTWWRAPPWTAVQAPNGRQWVESPACG